VAVFVGHNSSSLPVGIPQRIEATPQGLYTETYILKGPAGDNLLAVAKDLLDHGQALGMSIGYRTHDSRRETAAGKTVRRILDYELKEYSFAAQQAIANPMALVSSVKARRKEQTVQSKVHTAMIYRVEQRDDSWVVLCDDDGDGDEDDNRVVGTYASADVANAVAVALGQQAADDGDEEDEQDSDDAQRHDAAGKTVATAAPHEAKAEWSTSYVNDLPNSSFLWVEDGEDDDEGKRVPRSKRHFPYKDASGKVDLPHLRNAIARIPQSNAPDDVKTRLQARARRLLAAAGGSPSDDDGKVVAIDAEAPEWKSGAPLALWDIGARLQELADRLVGEQKAMALLGEDHKGYHRMRPPLLAEARGLQTEVKKVLDFAEAIERGEDGRQRLAWLKQQWALTEVEA
jgi:hypothetical protein